MKTIEKTDIVNKNIRNIDKIRNEVAREVFENSNEKNRALKNLIADDNLTDSKVQESYTIVKLSIRRFNRFVKIENDLNNVDRKANITTFAAIDKISIEKK